MYSMVLLAALTSGTAAPDFVYPGFGNLGWSGWGGYGLGWNGWGGYGMDGWGWGYGGYGYGPSWYGNYGYSPMISAWGWGSPWGYGGAFPNTGATQSFYYNPAMNNPPREARLIVHIPPQASLTIDDYPTQSRSDTRVFTTPPLEHGKTYTYTLRGELNRDGRFVHVTKSVEVKAGEVSDVTVRFGDTDREELGAPATKSSSSK